MSITNNCMVANLQIGIWQGYRLDKDASRKVVEDANAEQDAARVNKHLIPKEALKQIVSASNAVRTHFYKHTLPWKDNGDRLLTRTMYAKFIEEHAALTAAFKGHVDEFLETGYPDARARAEFRMGELFNPADYPPARDLSRRFYVSLDIDAVTEANDFRVALDQQAVDEVRTAMEDAMRRRLGTAMKDVWARLGDALGHFAAKMSDKDAIFRDSTVRNLEEIVDMLPALNVLNDPDLDRVHQEIKAKLSGLDVKDLRKDPVHRAAMGAEAQAIVDSMAGFMRAFGGSS